MPHNYTQLTVPSIEDASTMLQKSNAAAKLGTLYGEIGLLLISVFPGDPTVHQTAMKLHTKATAAETMAAEFRALSRGAAQ